MIVFWVMSRMEEHTRYEVLASQRRASAAATPFVADARFK